MTKKHEGWAVVNPYNQIYIRDIRPTAEEAIDAYLCFPDLWPRFKDEFKSNRRYRCVKVTIEECEDEL